MLRTLKGREGERRGACRKESAKVANRFSRRPSSVVVLCLPQRFKGEVPFLCGRRNNSHSAQ